MYQRIKLGIFRTSFILTLLLVPVTDDEVRRYVVFIFGSVATWAVSEPSYSVFLRTVWIVTMFDDLFHCILGILVFHFIGNFFRVRRSGAVGHFCDAVN